VPKDAPAAPAGGDVALEVLLEKGVVHQPYALKPLVDAVISVGYDGPLALDYRGTGDVTMALMISRDELLACIGDANDD